MPIFLLAAMAAMSAAPVQAPAGVDGSLLPYVRPDRLVRLRDRRVLHLRCMGHGAPTVILTAGLGEWGETWRLVQPAVAKRTKTCAWDRAGIGFSSGTFRPQTVTATTTDLEDGLRAGGLRGPFVVVGHSLGGFESLLFKDRHPSAVRGMVLVDPSIPDQVTRFRQAAPAFAASIEASNRRRPALLRRCMAKVRSGLRIGAPDPDQCLSFPDGYPPALAAALARLDLTPARWAANISLANRFVEDTRLVVKADRRYGAMPLIVLTSSRLAPFGPATPPAARADAPRLLHELTRAHDELAALSSVGENRVVPDSGHYIQIEQPAAVIDAILNVVDAVRGGGPASRPAIPR